MWISGRVTVTEKCDPRTLDAILDEITLLSSRADLYLRFMRRKITVRPFPNVDIRHDYLTLVIIIN